MGKNRLVRNFLFIETPSSISDYFEVLTGVTDWASQIGTICNTLSKRNSERIVVRPSIHPMPRHPFSIAPGR